MARKMSKEEANAEIFKKLEALTSGGRVAIVTMIGTFCPITVAHIDAFIQARSLLLGKCAPLVPCKLEQYDLVLGFIGLNQDAWTVSKLANQGEPYATAGVSINDRKHMVDLATSDQDWIYHYNRSLMCVPVIADPKMLCQERFPNIDFVQYLLNGADDVQKYEKWRHCDKNQRLITVGRPGYTEKVCKCILDSKVDPAFCVLGPELSGISSTMVREALRDDKPAEFLQDKLHPKVFEWCTTNKAYKKKK